MELKYSPTERMIFLEKDGHLAKVIDNNNPSFPVFSPKKNYAAFISPYEWEEMSVLYLINLDSAEKKVLIEPSNDLAIPKDVIWISNDTLAVILGQGHGTVAIGGNVFTINLYTEEIKQLTKYSEEIQITNIELSDETLKLSGLKYKDNNFLESVTYKKSIVVKDII